MHHCGTHGIWLLEQKGLQLWNFWKTTCSDLSHILLTSTEVFWITTGLTSYCWQKWGKQARFSFFSPHPSHLTRWYPFDESCAIEKQEAWPSKHHAPIATVWGVIPYLCALTERRDSTFVSESLSGSAVLESVLGDDSLDDGIFLSGILRGGTPEESLPFFGAVWGLGFWSLSEILGGVSLNRATDSALKFRAFSSRLLSLRDKPRPRKPLRGRGLTDNSLRKRFGGPCSKPLDDGGRLKSSLFLLNGRPMGLSWGRRGG